MNLSLMLASLLILLLGLIVSIIKIVKYKNNKYILNIVCFTIAVIIFVFIIIDQYIP